MNTQRTITIGGIYQHYKGKQYKIIALARDTEDPSSLRVIYQSLYTCPEFGQNQVWDRPYSMFIEQIELNGQHVNRFELVHGE